MEQKVLLGKAKNYSEQPFSRLHCVMPHPGVAQGSLNLTMSIRHLVAMAPAPGQVFPQESLGLLARLGAGKLPRG